MNGATPTRTGFHVWVRRQDASEAPYALRFEVLGGRGILRVARPGVLIDPPARPVGTEERLTGAQLRQSRFLHVRENGRERIAYVLTHLDEPGLERLPAGEWVELRHDHVGAIRILALPVREVEDVQDDPTNPTRAMLRELSRDLRHLVERTRPADDEHELLEADSLTGEEPLPAGDEDLFAAGDAEEDVGDVFTDLGPPARPGPPTPPPPPSRNEPPARGGMVWSSAPVHYDAGAFDVETFDETPEEEPTSAAAPPAAARPASPASIPPTPLAPPALQVVEPEPEPEPPALLDPSLRLHPRLTTLVRYFRRRASADGERIRELEARVALLEARLAETSRAGR